MQAVVVVRAVPQQERRRSELPRRMAARDEVRVLVRVLDLDAHRRVPAIGDGDELWIERGTQPNDELGQGVGEVLVFAASETVSRHHHPAAEEVVVRIQRDQGVTLLRAEQSLDSG